MDAIRDNFNKSAKDFNTKQQNWRNLIDSIRSMADTNQLLAIEVIDNALATYNDATSGNISELHFTKGLIFHKIDSFENAIYEFTVAGWPNSPSPKCLSARANSYLKVKKYELALNDLRTAAEINYDY